MIHRYFRREDYSETQKALLVEIESLRTVSIVFEDGEEIRDFNRFEVSKLVMPASLLSVTVKGIAGHQEKMFHLSSVVSWEVV